ncbi:MAG: hypothetical protein K2X93_08485 [Candidatus Obscuribacterales bacterium]|nr:hypothetical protein [Candidatus Obscuribacterales bacterium]
MATHDEHAHDEHDSHGGDHGHDDHHHEGPIAHVEVVPVKSFEDGTLALVLAACFCALSALMIAWGGIKAAPSHHETEGIYTPSHSSLGHQEHGAPSHGTEGATTEAPAGHEGPRGHEAPSAVGSAPGNPTAPPVQTTPPATPTDSTAPSATPAAPSATPVPEAGH